MSMRCTLLKGLQEEHAHPAIAIHAQVLKTHSLLIGHTLIVIRVPTVDKPGISSACHQNAVSDWRNQPDQLEPWSCHQMAEAPVLQGHAHSWIRLSFSGGWRNPTKDPRRLIWL